MATHNIVNVIYAVVDSRLYKIDSKNFCVVISVIEKTTETINNKLNNRIIFFVFNDRNTGAIV